MRLDLVAHAVEDEEDEDEDEATLDGNLECSISVRGGGGNISALSAAASPPTMAAPIRICAGSSSVMSSSGDKTSLAIFECKVDANPDLLRTVDAADEDDTDEDED